MPDREENAYRESIAWLESFIDYERTGLAGLRSERYSLDHFIEFMRRLENPQNKLRLVHIAGTKGKGSTGSLLAAILATAGYKVGFYSSPHLVDYRERIQINGEWIPEGHFSEVIDILRSEWRTLGSPGTHTFRTVFELLTAACFLYFSRQKIDIGFIETGLGGRLDATNIITPILSVITVIGYEHQYLLGNTIEEIATEKAGIIKPGMPVVVAEQVYPEALHVLTKASHKDQSPLYQAEKTVLVREREIVTEGQRLLIEMDGGRFVVFTSMHGEHQVRNIQTVLMTVGELRKAGFVIPQSAIIQGINDWRIPGRIEILSRDPLIILDGAHCRLSMRSLIQTLPEIQQGKRFIFLMALMSDKEPQPLLEPIIERYPESMILCYPAPTPRTMSPDLLVQRISETGLNARAFSSSDRAVWFAMNILNHGYAGIVQCGTFYSIIPVRRQFQQILGIKN